MVKDYGTRVQHNCIDNNDHRMDIIICNIKSHTRCMVCEGCYKEIHLIQTHRIVSKPINIKKVYVLGNYNLRRYTNTINNEEVESIIIKNEKS